MMWASFLFLWYTLPTLQKRKKHLFGTSGKSIW